MTENKYSGTIFTYYAPVARINAQLKSTNWQKYPNPRDWDYFDNGALYSHTKT